MTNDDKLRDAIDVMTGDDVTTPELSTVIARNAARRGRAVGSRVALIAASVAVVTGAALLLSTGSDEPRTTDASSEGVADCPGTTPRILGLSDAELKDRGAADALPEYGTTTRHRVEAAVSANPQLRTQYADAVVSVGPGWGLTYADGGATYRHEPDYAVNVRYPAAESCPAMAPMFIIYGDARIPVRFVYPTAKHANVRDYDVRGVTDVVVSGGLDVSIGEGGEAMNVEAPPDVFRDVHVSVQAGIVTVRRTSRRSRSDKEVKVNLRLPLLQSLKVRGGVMVSTAAGMVAPHFTADLDGGVEWIGEFVSTETRTVEAVVSATGGVSIDLSGSLEALTFDGSGGVQLDAADLRALRVVRVTVSGGASADVTAIERFIRAVAHGGASITYGGVASIEDEEHDISSSIDHR